MGASESKLVFKKGIFRLYEDHAIPPDDPLWSKVDQLGYENLSDDHC